MFISAHHVSVHTVNKFSPTLQSYIFNWSIPSNVTVPSMTKSSKYLPSFRIFPTNICMYFSPHTCHISLRCHCLLSDEMNVKYLVRFTNSSIISLFDFLPTTVASSDLGSNIVLRTLFTNIVSLCSSLKVTDYEAPIYKTTGKLFPANQNLNFSPL